MGAHEETRLRVELFDFVIRHRQRRGGHGFQFRDQFVPGLRQLFQVSDCRLAARGHHLRLESLGEHDAGVMPDEIARLLFNEQGRFHHVTLGRILRFDDGQFLRRVVAEHVLKQRVEARRVLHDAVRRALLVKDWHGCAVEFRVLEDGSGQSCCSNKQNAD